MKRIYKVCVLVVLIDLLLYILLFHSGIILPFFDSPNRKLTSFPEGYWQKSIWVIFHFTAIPIAKLISLNEKYLFLLIIQDVWVILLVNYIFFQKKKKQLDEEEIK
jgi:hypothetical protein